MVNTGNIIVGKLQIILNRYKGKSIGIVYLDGQNDTNYLIKIPSRKAFLFIYNLLLTYAIPKYEQKCF